MDIDKRLADTMQAVKERDRLLARITNLRRIMREQKKTLEGLKQKMKQEETDVEKLDGITLLNLWHSIRGTKDIAKQKEQEEYLGARLKYDEARTALEAQESELRKMEKALTEMGDPDADYQQAVLLKEEFLMRSCATESRRLFEIADNLAGLKAQQTELQEALSAGNKAKEALSAVKDNLNSARGWGAVDVLGGGLIITAIKHSHLDQARKSIKTAQKRLGIFRQEISDIQTEEFINIGNITAWGDFIFDGLLFDLIVQSQINSARERVRQVEQNVQSTMVRLQRILEDNRQKILKLEEERKHLIEGTDIARTDLV